MIVVQTFQLFYKHFDDQLTKKLNQYFDGTIQPVPFWDFPLLLSISQSNLSKPPGNKCHGRIIIIIEDNYSQLI